MSKGPIAFLTLAATLLLFATSVCAQSSEDTSLKSELLRLAHDWEHVKLRIIDRDDLEQAKRARDILEMVEKTHPATMDAGAPTTLGLLYDRVPPFPIGFGDKAKARYYLQEAVRNAPNGLDANYFYGDFLFRQDERAEAIKVLEHALTLPELSNRPIWDKSRRAEIRKILSQLQKGERTPAQ